MALQKLSQTEVYYGKSDKRVLSLWSGDLSALTTEDQVTCLALSALPGDYSPTGNSLIQALYRRGISVKDLAQDKLADFRNPYHCWISREVKGAAFQRIVVYEPSGHMQAYDHVNYLFSAIRSAQGNDNTPISVALSLLSTGSAGADEIEMMERIFSAAYHSCGMQFPFSEIKIVLYHTKKPQEELVKKFNELCVVYQDLEKIELPASYAYGSYASTVSSKLAGKQLPDYLTYRQAFGICMYTSGFYRAINGTLRDRDKSPDTYIIYRKLLPLLEAIDTGLMNMPEFDHGKNTYRGEASMSDQRLAEHAKGNTVCNLAYTSSSYAEISYYYNKYRFVFTPRYGVNIEGLSLYPGEKEVLFGQQMHYLVNDVQKGSFWQFYAQEQSKQLRR